MKNTIIIGLLIVGLVFVLGCGETINFYQLKKINGIYYTKKEGKPFTGKVVASYPSGQLRFEGYLIDGKLNGKNIDYYDNGQEKYEMNYNDGKLHGKRRYWHKNGLIISETEFKNGLEHGKRINYNEKGQVLSETIYKDGVAVK